MNPYSAAISEAPPAPPAPPGPTSSPVAALDIDDPSLDGLSTAEQFQKCFPIGSVFPNRHEVYTLVNKLSARHHFLVNKHSKTSLVCACNGVTQVSASVATGVRKAPAAYKTDCKWQITLGRTSNSTSNSSSNVSTTSNNATAADNTPPEPTKGRRRNYTIGDLDECKISKLSLEHNCNPSAERYIFIKKRSGYGISGRKPGSTGGVGKSKNKRQNTSLPSSIIQPRPPVPIIPVDINDPSLDGLSMKEQFQKCFPTGSVFPNRHMLHTLVNKLSARFHFQINKHSKLALRCACNGVQKSASTGQRKAAISYKTDCKWVINIRNVTGKDQIGDFDECRIASAQLDHNCNPTPEKYIALQKRSGRTLATMTTSTKYVLCMMLCTDAATPTVSIRSLLERVSPDKSLRWTGKEIGYIKIKILGMLEKMPPECFKSYESFKEELESMDPSLISLESGSRSSQQKTKSKREQDATSSSSDNFTQSEDIVYNQLRQLGNDIANLSRKLPMNTRELIGGSMVALRNVAQHGNISKPVYTSKAGIIDPNANANANANANNPSASEQMINYWQRFIKNFSKDTTSVTTGKNKSKNKRPLSSVPVANQNNSKRPKSLYHREAGRQSLDSSQSDKNKGGASSTTTPSGSSGVIVIEERCKFCQQTGHNATNCAKIKQYTGDIITNTWAFKIRVKEKYPFGPIVTKAYSNGIFALQHKRFKHLQVHSIHPKRKLGPNEIFHAMKDLMVCVTIINEDGAIDTELRRVYMDGKEFGWVVDMIATDSRRFLFDDVVSSSIGKEFTNRVAVQRRGYKSKNSTPSSNGNDGAILEECAFCRQTSHTIFNCAEKKKYGNAVRSVDDFRRSVKEEYPFGRVIDRPNATVCELPQSEFKHLLVHSIHPKRAMGRHEKFETIAHIVACVTIISSRGVADDKLKRIFIDGTEFSTALDLIQKKSSRFLFDNVILSSTGTEFTTRADTERSAPSSAQLNPRPVTGKDGPLTMDKAKGLLITIDDPPVAGKVKDISTRLEKKSSEQSNPPSATRVDQPSGKGKRKNSSNGTEKEGSEQSSEQLDPRTTIRIDQPSIEGKGKKNPIGAERKCSAQSSEQMNPRPAIRMDQPSVGGKGKKNPTGAERKCSAQSSEQMNPRPAIRMDQPSVEGKGKKNPTVAERKCSAQSSEQFVPYATATAYPVARTECSPTGYAPTFYLGPHPPSNYINPHTNYSNPPSNYSNPPTNYPNLHIDYPTHHINFVPETNQGYYQQPILNTQILHQLPYSTIPDVYLHTFPASDTVNNHIRLPNTTPNDAAMDKEGKAST